MRRTGHAVVSLLNLIRILVVPGLVRRACPQAAAPRDGQDRGLTITGLAPGGGAEKAGLAEGDTFLSVGETKVTTLEDILAILDKHKVGDTVKVRYRRKDQELEADVVLGD